MIFFNSKLIIINSYLTNHLFNNTVKISLTMANKWIHLSGNNKKHQKYTSFSDIKMNTQSTADRANHQKSTNEQSVSQFRMINKISNDPIKQIKQPKFLTQLTFTSIQYKRCLSRRIESFISSITTMLQLLDEKKIKRTQLIHNFIKPLHQTSKHLTKKITFQLIGNYLKNDQFLEQIHKQQSRLKQLLTQIQILQNNIKTIKGGFIDHQIITHMNRLNRIEGYYSFLFKIIQQLQNIYAMPTLLSYLS